MGVKFERACIFAHVPVLNVPLDDDRNLFIFAPEIPVHAQILNRNNLFTCCHRQTRLFNPLSLSQTHFELHHCMACCHWLIACCVSQLLLCTAQRAEGRNATGRKRCFRWRRWSPRSERRSVKVCLLTNPRIHKKQPLSYTIMGPFLLNDAIY